MKANLFTRRPLVICNKYAYHILLEEGDWLRPFPFREELQLVSFVAISRPRLMVNLTTARARYVNIIIKFLSMFIATVKMFIEK